MLTLSVEDVLALAVLWLVCGLVSALVFIRFAVLRYAGQAVVSALCDPTDDVRAAITSLLSIVITSSIRRTTMRKGEDGQLHGETEDVPFVHALGRELWQYLGMLRKASNGGKTSQAANELGELLPLSMGPRRGQSTSEYLMEQLAVRIGPQVEQLITRKIEETLNK